MECLHMHCFAFLLSCIPVQFYSLRTKINYKGSKTQNNKGFIIINIAIVIYYLCFCCCCCCSILSNSRYDQIYYCFSLLCSKHCISLCISEVWSLLCYYEMVIFRFYVSVSALHDLLYFETILRLDDSLWNSICGGGGNGNSLKWVSGVKKNLPALASCFCTLCRGRDRQQSVVCDTCHGISNTFEAHVIETIISESSWNWAVDAFLRFLLVVQFTTRGNCSFDV